jgi:hypothetical protein
MKIVISQPRYLPTLNYLIRLYFSDCFVLLDNVQRQARGYENRNKLLMPSAKWLSISISSSSREVLFLTKIDNHNWVDEHKRIINDTYKNHPFFDPEIINLWYEGVELESCFVTAMRVYLLNICTSLNFEPKIVLATDVLGRKKRTGVGNLVEIVSKIDPRATYVSGSNGRGYGVKESFLKEGVDVIFHDWIPKKYKQNAGLDEFIPYLAFPDMVFNSGISQVENLVKNDQVFNDE